MHPLNTDISLKYGYTLLTAYIIIHTSVKDPHGLLTKVDRSSAMHGGLTAQCLMVVFVQSTSSISILYLVYLGFSIDRQERFLSVR